MDLINTPTARVSFPNVEIPENQANQFCASLLHSVYSMYMVFRIALNYFEDLGGHLKATFYDLFRHLFSVYF